MLKKQISCNTFINLFLFIKFLFKCLLLKLVTIYISGGDYAAVVDELNMSDAKRAGCFVDGCKVNFSFWKIILKIQFISFLKSLYLTKMTIIDVRHIL